LGCKKEIGRYKRRRRRIISRWRMVYKNNCFSYFYMHCLVQLHFTDFLMIWLWKKSCEIHADVCVMTAEGFSLIITKYFFLFFFLSPACRQWPRFVRDTLYCHTGNIY
jgi:hypothetical protein